MRKINQYKNSLFVVIILSLYLISIINSAWLSDDSFISLAQIVNFHNGDGLVYNFGERVQAFTHPSWFFVLALVTYITNEYYITIFITSIVFSMLSIVIIIYYAYGRKRTSSALIGLTILLFSKAFIDYTTSGLENPLSYLLFSAILYILLKFNNLTNRHLLIIY